MDAEQALRILERYAPELSEPQLLDLLGEQTVRRTVGGLERELLDPYAAALAHLMNPATVKARTEGSVSETYIDPSQVAGYLERQSALLRESWPAADPVGEAATFDLTLDVRGWF